MKFVNDPGTCAPQDKPCVPQETVIKNVKLANAYVPFEKMCTTYTPMRALEEGTAFPELSDPYEREDKYRCEGAMQYE